MSTFGDFMIDKAVKDGERDERQRERIRALESGMRELIRGYVSMLETARERIIFYGGQCDDVPTMERGDPHLRKAREVLGEK